MSVGITARSLAAQTVPFAWVVAVDEDDPLRDDRMNELALVVPGVRFLTVNTRGLSRAQAAIAAYKAPWLDVIGVGPRLTTRIDDDDAFTPDALERMQELSSYALKARRWERRQKSFAVILPVGYRVWGRHYSTVIHGSNAMSSLYTPAGIEHIYTYMHREIAKHVRVISSHEVGDRKPGWLWVRHDDTLSGHKAALKPITPALRSKFPIDWSLIDSQPDALPEEGGLRFR